jgi:translation initiation factor IF-3
MANDDERPAKNFLERNYIRLIGPDGTDLGVVSLAEAIRLAKEAGHHLIEFNTKVEPTVVKMLNAEQYEQHLRDTQRFVN